MAFIETTPRSISYVDRIQNVHATLMEQVHHETEDGKAVAIWQEAACRTLTARLKSHLNFGGPDFYTIAFAGTPEPMPAIRLTRTDAAFLVLQLKNDYRVRLDKLTGAISRDADFVTLIDSADLLPLAEDALERLTSPAA